MDWSVLPQEHDSSEAGAMGVAWSARRLHVRFSLYGDLHMFIPVDGQHLRREGGSGPKPDGYLRTAATDSGVALSGYELGLRQVKDHFLRARRQHLGDETLKLHHRR